MGRTREARPAPVSELDPVALSLEGVGGEGDLAPGVVAVETRPVHVHAAHVQLAQARQHLLPVASPLPQRRQPRRRASDRTAAPSPAAPGCGPSSTNTLAALLRAGPASPPNRTASRSVAPPVRRRRSPPPSAPPRHVRHEPQLAARGRRPAPPAARTPPASAPSAASERVRHRQRLVLTPDLLELPRHRLHRLAPPRDHHALRPVHRRDRHRAPVRPRSPPRPAPRAASTATIAPPRGSACISRPRAAISRSPSSSAEHAGHARRHVLAHAVAHHHRGLDAPAAPQLRQRPLQREQRRLRVRRLVEQRARPPPNMHLEQRPLELPARSTPRTAPAPRGTPAASRTARAPSPRTATPGP